MSFGSKQAGVSIIGDLAITQNANPSGPFGNGGSGASGTGAGATSASGGKGVFIVGYWMEAA